LNKILAKALGKFGPFSVEFGNIHLRAVWPSLNCLFKTLTKDINTKRNEETTNINSINFRRLAKTNVKMFGPIN
jgi:hypothetical protein